MGDFASTAVLALIIAMTGVLQVEGTSAFISNERRLFHNLTDNLEMNVRPVNHSSSTVPLQFGLTLTRIHDLDERSQQLSTNLWMKMAWKDVQLTWKPEDFGGIKSIMIPSHLIWNPDIVLYNMAYTTEVNRINPDTNAVVSSDGSVLWIPHMNMLSTCSLDMSLFPYDTHNCTLKFGSWTYHKGLMNLSHYYTKELDVSVFQEHSEWELIGHDSLLTGKKYDCCPETYQDITYSVLLRRRNAYYTQVFVAPSVILLFITPTIFWLPPDCNEKMTLGTGVMVGQVLMLVMLENYIPAAHAVVPVIGRYFVFGLIMVGLSLVLSVMVRHVWSQSNRRKPVPRCLRTVVVQKLGSLLCVSADTWRTETNSPSATFRQLEDLDSGHVDTDTSTMVVSGPKPADDWCRMAVVLDRIFFLVFIIVIIATSLALLQY